MVGLYSTPYYQSGRHGPHDAKEVLRRGAAKVERGLGDRPLLQARVGQAIGEAMRASGARRSALGIDAVDTLRTARDLGFLYKSMGRKEAAAPLLLEAADGLRRSLGDDTNEALVATSLAASVLLDLRRLDEAEELLVSTIPRMKPELGEKGIAVYNLACVHALRGERDEALRLLRESQALNFAIGYFGDPNLLPLFDDPRFIPIAQAGYAMLPHYQARLAEWAVIAIGARQEGEAEAIYRYLLEVLPPQQADVLHGARARLRGLLVVQGRFREALPLIEQEIDFMRRQDHSNGAELALRLANLFQIRLALDDTAGALAAVDEAIARWDETATPFSLGRVTYLRACREAAVGNLDAAAELFSRAVDESLLDVEVLRDEVALRPLAGRPDFERARKKLENRRGPFADRFTAPWDREVPIFITARAAGSDAARTPPSRPVGPG